LPSGTGQAQACPPEPLGRPGAFGPCDGEIHLSLAGSRVRGDSAATQAIAKRG